MHLQSRACVLHPGPNNPYLKSGMLFVTPPSLAWAEATLPFDGLTIEQQKLVASNLAMLIAAASKAALLSHMLRLRHTWSEELLLRVSKFAILMPNLLNGLEDAELIVLSQSKDEYFVSEVPLHRFAQKHFFPLQFTARLAEQLMMEPGEELYKLLAMQSCLLQHRRVNTTVHLSEGSGLGFLPALKSAVRFNIHIAGYEDLAAQATQYIDSLLPEQLMEEAFLQASPAWTPNSIYSLSVVTQYLNKVKPGHAYCSQLQVKCSNSGEEAFQAAASHSSVAANWAQPPPPKKRNDRHPGSGRKTDRRQQQQQQQQQRQPPLPEMPVPRERQQFSSEGYHSQPASRSSW